MHGILLYFYILIPFTKWHIIKILKYLHARKHSGRNGNLIINFAFPKQMNNVRSSWTEHKLSPFKMCGPHRKYMVKQSTCFIYIIYPGKHNAILLLTYEAHTEQLERKQILYQTTHSSVTLGTPRLSISV